MRFRDRDHAGALLGERLLPLAADRPVVLGLPRGGVPVAARVAAALSAPLDVVLVRKVGVPFQPELAMGAVGEDDVVVMDDSVREWAGIDDAALTRLVSRQQQVLHEHAREFRSDRGPIDVHDRVVVIVDDGIATGATARAACEVIRARHARTVIVAVPVAPDGWVRPLAAVADVCTALFTPAHFTSVSTHYDDFSEITTDQVRRLLD
jgi:putative phosphoribosyl transferase